VALATDARRGLRAGRLRRARILTRLGGRATGGLGIDRTGGVDRRA